MVILRTTMRRRSRNYRANHRLEVLEERRLLAGGWQNPANHFDVDRSGLVSAQDALMVINALSTSDLPIIVLDSVPSPPTRFLDVNADDRVTALDALSIINALFRNSGPLNLAVSVDTDADPNGNGVVLDPSIEFRGQTARNAKIQLTVTALDLEFNAIEGQHRTAQGVSDDAGRFALRHQLFFGRNQVAAVATDELGRQTTVNREIVWGDVVADWNAALLNVVRDFTETSNDPYPGRIVSSKPPAAARNAAMIHGAMFDALNGIAGEYTPYLVTAKPQPEMSSIAAAATAAYEVAMAIYPDTREAAVWNATIAESLRGVLDGPEKVRGIEYGQTVAAAMLQARADDGSDQVQVLGVDRSPGSWERTPPDYFPALVPHWRFVKPFAIADPVDYRPPPPPALESAEYAQAVDEVMRLGRVDSNERTAKQTEIAIFWADGGGTATPPGHFNRIAMNVSLASSESTLDRARALALLNFALADAGIAAWDAKYEYDFWRPIDAIRRADEDGNAATVVDATWLPLLRTPNFPTYTSGHSTFGAAAATVLTALYGDGFTFASRSDGHTGLTQRPLDNVTRHFESFWEAAEENGISRIYGGIHYEFDNRQGLSSGRLIGEYVTANWLRPIVGI